MLDQCASDPKDRLTRLERSRLTGAEPLVLLDSRPNYLEEARATISSLGSQANYLIPLGILGPFSQWLQFPDWMREGTALSGSGPLPQTLTLRDDTVIMANMLERGHGPFLLEKTLASDRLITGPNVALIVRNAPTLAEAMKNMAIALGASNPNICATFLTCGETARFEVMGRVPRGRLLDFIAAIRIILGLRALERLLLRSANEARLQFSLSRTFGDQLFGAIAGRVELSSEANRLSFPARWIDRPNPDHDRILWKIAKQRVRAMERRATDRDLASRLRHRVSEVLSAENRVPRLKELAAELGMTDRTVVRKLSALGIRFQNIADEERKSLIKQYLADPSVSFPLIAKASGFSSLSSFSRSFRTWFGVSPSEHRLGDRAARVAIEPCRHL